MADLGVWTVDGDAPRRVSRSAVDLERHLEDWIVADSGLLPGGLTIVGRQVRVDGGFLDLLAIDRQDRWVVVELKRERLYRAALTQALDYASSIAEMEGDALEGLLRDGLARLGDAEKLSRDVRSQLNSGDGGRDVAVLLAGIGVEEGLERMVAHLGGYGVPISIVNFEVFEPEGGPRLLIREVTDEQSEPLPPQPRRTVGLIRQRAVDAGVAVQFDRFVEMSERAGLAVQPQKHSVRIAPKANRTRYLMYARPESGGMVISAGAAEFAEFFPELTEEWANARIGAEREGRHLSGGPLGARLDQIEAFLKDLPRPDTDAV